MPEIQLSPGGQLQWTQGSSDNLTVDANIGRGFQINWREGLFLLAARRPQIAALPDLRYW